MNQFGIYNTAKGIETAGLKGLSEIYWNQSPAQLVEASIKNGYGSLSDTGALIIDTGEFTGRSPKDKFIVLDDITRDSVDWGNFNLEFSAEKFDSIYAEMQAYLVGKRVWVKDAIACADPKYTLKARVVTEFPWQSQFVDNMFINPSESELSSFEPEWHVINVPSFMAIPDRDGTRQHNFAILNFTKKVILVGGTAYTGEIKKGIFTVLNYVLPHQKNVLSMHCSANVGKDGDTAVFFGLSGTGKTTLSADPNRALIGDDEHGWHDGGVFNFEGGCYAKCINLSKEGEPQIWNAIQFGSLLENVKFNPANGEIDYSDGSRTENTRVSYPIRFINNALEPSVGSNPKNIFFLTCDAFGVLPPISRLTKGQAMYHFISGYTAKVAGTEAGITEPTTTFSACFGAPFLPLHPAKYAEMLGEKMEKHNVNVWLINTGWSGGSYGVGKRMKLSYTRSLITAALEGRLDSIEYQKLPIFNLEVPVSCPNVPSEILIPRNTWVDKSAYDAKATDLAERFVNNFKKFDKLASAEILESAPVLN